MRNIDREDGNSITGGFQLRMRGAEARVRLSIFNLVLPILPFLYIPNKCTMRSKKSHAGTDPREPSKERCSDVLLLRMVSTYHS